MLNVLLGYAWCIHARDNVTKMGSWAETALDDDHSEDDGNERPRFFNFLNEAANDLSSAIGEFPIWSNDDPTLVEILRRHERH